MSNRLHEIDGIRGWAALVVILFHFVWELFGDLFPVLRNPVTATAFDGALAVYVFFVLSGDALSTAYLKNFDSRVLVKMILKRYLRLMFPIFISCFLVWVVMSVGINYIEEVSPILKNENFLGRFLLFDASIFRVIYYGLMGVFVSHSVATSYNPFLWPMAIELYGSFFLFGILFALPYLRKKYVVVSVVACYLLFVGSFYALFFVGLIFSMLRRDMIFEKLRNHSISKYSGVVLLLTLVVNTLILYVGNRPKQIGILMASIIVLLIYANPRSISFFSNRLSRYLGRISFSLYLMHFVVLISFASWMILYVNNEFSINSYTIFGVLILSLLGCLIVADLFSRVEAVYLKKLDIMISRQIVNREVVE